MIVNDVSLNPTRTGFLEVLKKMGADISVENVRVSSNEEYGNVIVKSSRLKTLKLSQKSFLI